jgi:imidazolonepropionase-like amidohydrolase
MQSQLAAGLKAVVLAVLAAAALPAQERPQAFVGAEIVPIAGPRIANGALVVQGGKIVAVGPRAAVQVPAGAGIVDLSGKVVMPGLVDSHSHIGGGSGGDATAALHPDVRILDSFNPLHPSLMRARAGGITTVNVMPGSGHLLSGQTLYLKLRNGRTMDDLLIRDAGGTIAGGIKMANGTNSIRPSGPFPGTRAKSAALVREQYTKALDYRDRVRRAGDDAAKLPPRDLAMESLLDAVEGRKIVHFHSHRHDDIMTALRLAKEFNFRIVLHHVTEGWKVAKEIAAAKAAASVIIIDSPGGKLEAVDLSLEIGAAMEKAGALVGFHTDDYITDSRLFLRSAGLAVRAGMSREGALKSVTIANAAMLDLDRSVGTLEPGKDADFVVLSGDPLSVYTKVLETWVEGVRVFDRANPAHRLAAVGGFGAAREGETHFDCYDEYRGAAQ